MKRDDQNKDADDDDEEDESKLEIKLISVITVYYLVRIHFQIWCISYTLSSTWNLFKKMLIFGRWKKQSQTNNQ